MPTIIATPKPIVARAPTTAREEAVAAASVGMGQIAILSPEGVGTAVLGSCVGLTLYDSNLRYAAMAHIVLPSSDNRTGGAGKFADTAVRAMVEKLRCFGIDPATLTAKLTGGASMFESKGPFQIGKQNIDAVVERLLQLRKSKQLRAVVKTNASTTTPEKSDRFTGCVAIGISTGGPPALAQLFGALVPPLPPIVIVQHMPQMFTGPFANRLNSLSAIRVREAAHGDILRPNEAIVAPGGKHLSLRRIGGRVEVVVADGDPVSGHKPSVDVMMRSAAQTFGKACVGVIMTGMGRDGADGCGFIRSAGGYVLGQDEETSDVYGMNKVAFVEGNVDVQTSLHKLAEAIALQARRRCVGTSAAPVAPQLLPLRKGS